MYFSRIILFDYSKSYFNTFISSLIDNARDHGLGGGFGADVGWKSSTTDAYLGNTRPDEVHGVAIH